MRYPWALLQDGRNELKNYKARGPFDSYRLAIINYDTPFTMIVYNGIFRFSIQQTEVNYFMYT